MSKKHKHVGKDGLPVVGSLWRSKYGRRRIATVRAVTKGVFGTYVTTTSLRASNIYTPSFLKSYVPYAWPRGAR